MRSLRTPQGYASTVDGAGNYDSGDDYVVEFLGYRFSFNAEDFEQRVTAAAVKLGLLGGNELDGDETADLVELVERDAIEEPRIDARPLPRSPLGRRLPRRGRVARLLAEEARLPRRVARPSRQGRASSRSASTRTSAEFSYHDPRGGRALLELLPTPSWHELQYRR